MSYNQYLLSPVGTHDPVPIEEFADHVKMLHANDDYLFAEEYTVSYFTENMALLQFSFLVCRTPTQSND